MLRQGDPERMDVKTSSKLIRRFVGPCAKEVFLICRPQMAGGDGLVRQISSVYRQLRDAMRAEGGTLEHVVRETIFFRNILRDLEDFVHERKRIIQEMGASNAYCPAPVFVEQPPLDTSARFEISVHAVIPHPHVSTATWTMPSALHCSCNGKSEVGARVLLLAGEKHVFAGNIYGSPGHPFEEGLDMFRVAEDILKYEGMDFRSVARTWIYLRDMERDYGDFNRARRAFFQSRGIELRPASTGICGTPSPEKHNYVMGFYAIQSPHPVPTEAMTTPTLNEAHEYGSDFSRGLRVVDANKVALFVSGTASVDEQGSTVHVDDFDAQVERMMLNVEVLLDRQGSSFSDIVNAVTYIKRGADAPRFARVLKEKGMDCFPNVVVEAGVCRTDLLCEIEALAFLPRK